MPRDHSSMSGHDLTATTAENYVRFATIEAAARSPRYEALALAVAGDDVILSFLDGLPREKRQPNLLFAAACFLLGTPADHESLRRLVDERPTELAQLMVARRTQTNEAARCAMLLPALSILPEPLALLEVGAAAGLTLLVDRYSYDYDGHFVAGRDRSAPTISCHVQGPVPLPERVPEVAWRAGLDLNPLDVDDPEDVHWLFCLLWPGESDRAERLSGAVETARRAKPRLHRGDLRTGIEAVVSEAPRDATLVVYHTAVLAYVPTPDRLPFGETLARLGAVWLSNEGPGVLPWVLAPTEQDSSCFVLVKDGSEVLARTDPHGTWLEWL